MSVRHLRTAASTVLACAVALIPGLAFAKPEPESGLGMPRDMSHDGHNIDWLIHVTLGFTTILFVIMCIWLVTACIKHGKGHKAEYDHGNSRAQVRHAAIISAIIFFVVDGNLWVNSTWDVNGIFWNFAKAEKDPKAVRIEINAHQWAWDARYAGPDGKFNTPDDIVTLNDIRVPVDAPVIFELASTDVIHSFYLPNFRVKQDAMPGMINRLWFRAKKTGEFDIGCAQHCGTHHYKMKANLTVMSAEEFARWSTEASANGVRAYNAEDKDAHWGWDWKLD